MGTIIGNYKHVAIPYDWGEYSVKTVTKKNGAGNDVTAYEIIEYHGADLTSSYQLPDIITIGDGLSASIVVTHGNKVLDIDMVEHLL